MTRAPLIPLVVALGLAWSSTASAQCGGGGGGHGGGFHGGFGFGGFRGGSMRPACTDRTRVVGQVACGSVHHAGDGWRLGTDIPIAVEFGGLYRWIDGGHGDVAFATTNQGYRYTYAQTDSPGGSLGGATLRLVIGFGRFLYAGIEGSGSLGPGLVGDTTPPTGWYTVGLGTASYFAVGALVGTHVVIGPIGLRAELAAFAGFFAMDFPVHVSGCGFDQRFETTDALVVPRVGVEVWLSPWVTLGARAGVDVVGPGREFEADFGIGFHTRTYDGARP
jgi:hypothetical protein